MISSYLGFVEGSYVVAEYASSPSRVFYYRGGHNNPAIFTSGMLAPEGHGATLLGCFASMLLMQLAPESRGMEALLPR